MLKIFVATPMYGGQCTSPYLNSLLSLQIEFLKNNYEMNFSGIQNESLITRARNTLSDMFLETDCDYLLFIDADHGFNPSDIIKMIKCDLDILCAIPPKKTINWDSVINAAKNKIKNLEFYTGNFVINLDSSVKEISANEPFEIQSGGTGLMLIKRKVFTEMKKSLPQYMANNTAKEILDKKMITEFFTTTIHDGILLSEDYNFCKTWKDMGGKIYAAPWVGITHVGTYEFSGSFLASLELNNM
jgi:hypothetical protein